jgi:hypothetical protein
MSAIGTVLAFSAGVATYILPSIIASIRTKAPNRFIILNILVGWTVIGWAILLYWATRPRSTSEQVAHHAIINGGGIATSPDQAKPVLEWLRDPIVPGIAAAILALIVLSNVQPQSANKAGKPTAATPAPSAKSANAPQVAATPAEAPVTPAPIAPPPPPPSAWDYQFSKDALTDATETRACTTSTNQAQLTSPYKDTSLRLCIRQNPRSGLNVFFWLENGGQFVCRSLDGCSVQVRFDSNPPSAYSVAEPSDYSSDTLFISNASRFLANAKKSERFIIEVNLYDAGSQSIFFDSQGLEWPPKKD